MNDPGLIEKKLALIETYVRELRTQADPSRITGARCDGGRLVITPPDEGDFPILLGDDNDDWHVYDYALFFENIETNAVTRTQAWHANRHASARPPAIVGRDSPNREQSTAVAGPPNP